MSKIRPCLEKLLIRVKNIISIDSLNNIVNMLINVCLCSMDKHQIFTIFVILANVLLFSYGQYQIPEPSFEAFSPRGLRVSIPADKGVQLFGFHAKVNMPILQIEPGDINQDVTKSTNGRFTYVDSNIKLKEGDVLHYWVFVQHDQLGFRMNEREWKVDKLLPLKQLTEVTCNSPSVTKVEDQNKVCPGDEITNYGFAGKPLDTNIWLVEQYIPTSPDWPFNIYRNTPDVVNVGSDGLVIKPKIEEENTKKAIDLNPGCTRRGSECVKEYRSFWNPPIVSGKLRLKKAFCFGNVTIRAKLPIGDYVYPEIYLEDVMSPKRRILIAYARGNKDYRQKSGIDEGGKKLFGGPYTNVVEPMKSKYLSTYQHTEHIGNDWHIFTVVWTPDVIDLFIDGNHYGHLGAEVLQKTEFNKDRMVRLVLGVGTGGPVEFPDGYTSSGQSKPYNSSDRDSMKYFIQNKAVWIDTWTENTQLLVDYVSIIAM